jgi:hypothetical protein
MKLSISIAILILIIGAILGWNEEQNLATATKKHRSLVARATALGIPTDIEPGDDPATGPDGSAHTARRSRALRDDSAAAAEARAYAEELIAFAIRFKAHQDNGAPEDEEIQKGIYTHLERLATLGSGQLEILIGEIKRNPSLDDDIRRGIIGLSISLLGEQHPQSALTIALEAADIYDNPEHAQSIVANALGKWAEQDPLAAVDWLRSHQDSHPHIHGEQTKLGILRGAALQDPRLAIQLVDGLELETPRKAGQTIAGTAQSSTQRTVLLEELRKEADNNSDHLELLNGALSSIGKNMAREGFEASKDWLAENPLSPDETFRFIEGMQPHQTGDDTGRWVEWIDSQAPDAGRNELIDHRVHHLVSGWTQSDYAAVGSWLNNSDSLGRSKPAAVHAYAKSVSLRTPNRRQLGPHPARRRTPDRPAQGNPRPLEIPRRNRRRPLRRTTRPGGITHPHVPGGRDLSPRGPAELTRCRSQG